MNTENEDTSFGRLGDLPRLPLKAAGWETVDSEIVLARPRRFDGADSYALHTNSSVDSQIVAAVKQLLEEKPDDFQIASTHIQPEGWRLLFYRGLYTMEALTAFRFHADDALRQLCRLQDDDPPAAWIGTESELENIAADLELSLREIGENPSSAAWSILCLAQRANLTPTELLVCSWHDPAWVKGFTENVRILP